MPLDIATLLVVCAALLLLTGVLFLGVAATGPARHWSAPWGTYFLLAGLGTLVAGQRDADAPWLGIQLGGGLLVMAVPMSWVAARIFVGRPVARPWLVVLAPLAWVALCQWPGFSGGLEARVVAYSLLSIVCAFGTAAVMAGRPWRLHRGRLAAAVLLSLHGLAMLARIPLTLTVGPGATEADLPGSAWYAVLLIENILFNAGLAFAIMASAYEQAAQAERAGLVAAADAERAANDAKSRFLARLSHELRTPLNSMLGFAQLLAADPRLSEEQRGQAATMAEGGRHFLGLLNDLLDLARIDAGRFVLAPAPLVLGSFLPRSVDLMRDEARARDITLGLTLAPDLPATVLADETRLRQILLNLLSNAVKFSAAGSTVEINAVPLPARGLQLVVADRGPGVPPRLRQRLFEDFARLHLDATGPAGIGLGLSISQGLARAMGGHLAYADRPGGGALFTVELPLPVLTTTVPESLKKVLVIDGMAPHRHMLRLLLEQAGHRVVEADGRLPGLAALGREAVDLVLIDLDAPNGEGLTTLRAIRGRPGKDASLPVVAMTNRPESEGVAIARSLGLVGSLPKPVLRDRLLSLVGTGRGVPARA